MSYGKLIVLLHIYETRVKCGVIIEVFISSHVRAIVNIEYDWDSD